MKQFDRFISWYFSREALPYWGILFIDLLTVALAGFVAFALNHGIAAVARSFVQLAASIGLFALCYVIGFRVFHTYSNILRFSSFADLRALGLASLVGVVLMFVIQSVFDFHGRLIRLSSADMIFAAIIALALMWAMRIWVKTLYDSSLNRKRSKQVFIYGVRDGGVALAKSLNNNEASPYVLKGFVSDDMVGRHLMGHPVYRADASVVSLMEKRSISALLVPRYKNQALRANNDMVNALIEAGIKIMMFPDAHEMSGDTGSAADDNDMKHLREVKVEDLLPREEIKIDMESIGRHLRGRRILITGAAGSIGSEIVRQVACFKPSDLLLVDQAETPLHDLRLLMAHDWPDIKCHTMVADITCRARMEALFHHHRPEFVFHAAAYKHVPMMEDNPSESIANNVEGTRVVADLAVKYGVDKFVMISTDKAVNPTNVMGCSKRICEIYVQALDKALKEGRIEGHTKFVTTRFGNVLGSNGSVIPLFMAQIKAGGPVTVTHPEIIRFFMLIPEACRLVLEAGTMGNGGEIFVFDMGEPVKIADLARRMITMSGATDIEIKFTGLRDGEKLYEEMLSDEEVTMPTFHDKIRIAKVREYEYEAVSKTISMLVNACFTADDMEVVAMMKRIVPEFRSQYSRYEILDIPAEELN